MKKILLCLMFLLSADSFAIVSCPKMITCNYEEGSCDGLKEWSLQYLGIPFSGYKSFPLAAVQGYKVNDSIFLMYCTYYESLEQQQIFHFQSHFNKLIGNNWVYSGFGKKEAKCSDISIPEECAGEKRV